MPPSLTECILPCHSAQVVSNDPGDGDIGPMELKEQFMHKFQNISRIMDCVGCEKCKLWGKLEVLGIGTVREPPFATFFLLIFMTAQYQCLSC